MNGDPGDLASFGFNRTISAEGKAIAGDFVTIVQHPEGQKKQVTLRDNRIVDVFDEFLHYEADTQPGSSGSPVFNDQWELAALHHASVPAPEHPELGKFVNEGIRISRLLAFISAQDLTSQQRALVSGLLATGPGHEGAAAPAGPGAVPTASVTVPLQVTITVREQPPGMTGAAAGFDEAITIDPDYC